MRRSHLQWLSTWRSERRTKRFTQQPPALAVGMGRGARMPNWVRRWMRVDKPGSADMRKTIVKTPRLRTAFVSVLALALCSVIVIETVENSRLSKQISALKEENSRLSRAGNLAPVQDETRLSTKERQELMRLRGEVGLLRNQIIEMVAPEPKPDDAPQAVEAPPVVLPNDTLSVVHKTDASMNKALTESRLVAPALPEFSLPSASGWNK
jgi:hypothetical protein